MDRQLIGDVLTVAFCVVLIAFLCCGVWYLFQEILRSRREARRDLRYLAAEEPKKNQFSWREYYDTEERHANGYLHGDWSPHEQERLNVN